MNDIIWGIEISLLSFWSGCKGYKGWKVFIFLVKILSSCQRNILSALSSPWRLMSGSNIAAAIEDMKTIKMEVSPLNRILSYFSWICFDYLFLAYLIQFYRILNYFVKAIKPRTSDEVRGREFSLGNEGSTLEIIHCLYSHNSHSIS